jgi:carboxypeptidase Taq
MGEKYQALVSRLREINNINRAASVLHWDLETQMPSGGTPARASQLETLSRIGHEMFVAEETGRLLEDAAHELNGADYDSDEASMIRVVQADYEESTKLPTSLVAELASVTSLAHEVWAKARAENDFKSFQSTLERIIELKQQEAEYLGYQENPYDALLNEYERGITAARVKEIFDGHKPQLVELIAAVSEYNDRVSDEVLHQNFDEQKQWDFSVWAVSQFGYDFQRGRLDKSVHPFSISFSRGDARITTRIYPDFLNPCLFGTFHEAGHAMYEQGSPEALDGTPIAGGTSLGVHESQSRMWENIVGRSRGFWSWALPTLKEYFPAQLGNVDLDTFYKAINKVQRSFIRVEADEATYNLHVMLRFELEMDLLSGAVKVADLPEEWNERFEAFFGIVPPNDSEGVLQDVHWSSGLFGYFPTYALGNLLSAQYYNKALEAHPNIPDEIAQGKFDTLLGWLNENIHKHGRKYTSDELTRRITGEGIQSRDYIQYLQAKFSDIYGL